MKIIVAPDSFKGSLSSIQAADIIAAQFRIVFPHAEIVTLPLADGGEGSLDVLLPHLGAATITKVVSGPLGDPVTARYGLVENSGSAIIESAQACGMGLISAEKLNPLNASSFGLGELIRDALGHGAREIVVTLGGSATVDGGLGMAKALGYRFTDTLGRDVPQGGSGLLELSHIDSSAVAPRLHECRFRAAVDVTNPLTGPNGAAPVFAPQKGATKEMVAILEMGLSKLMGQLMTRGILKEEQPGDGAAGGLGAGLRAFCGAEIESGAEWVCRVVGLDHHLEGAGLLITGEGRTDAQTLQGKLCQIASRHARARRVPVLLLSGSIEDQEEIRSIADFAFSISSEESSLAEQIRNSESNLAQTALSIARTLLKRF